MCCSISEVAAADQCRYVLFSIGNVTPLLEAAFPECWDDETVCQAVWIQSITYLEVSGIIIGQILVGILGDWLGRRWGLIQDAVIMFIGLVMLSASWGVTLSKIMITISRSKSLTFPQMDGSPAILSPYSSTVSGLAASIR